MEKENRRETCVLCGKEAKEEVYTEISERVGYVVGCGQLCEACYKELREC